MPVVGYRLQVMFVLCAVVRFSSLFSFLSFVLFSKEKGIEGRKDPSG